MAIEAQAPCANCGGTAWSRDDTSWALVEVAGEQVRMGGAVLPVVALACNKCGAYRMFNPMLAGE